MSRVGLGYDSHRFAEGRPLVLCGLQIDHLHGLAGHSDADAALHAIIDAILGAIGAGDIGQQFPDDDPRYKDTDSALLLRQVMELARSAGWRVGNCDVTIIAEQPRLGPFKEQMRQRVAELLEVEQSAVAVKAKTNEGMGWIGRGEGLAALAVVMLLAAAQGRK